MKIKCSVKDKGYLTRSELIAMADWKRYTLPNLIKANLPERVIAVTHEALSLSDDWKKPETLTVLDGVRESVGFVILHLYDREKYPILDKHALNSIGINHRQVKYNALFWQEYVKFCQAKAECHGVCMRVLDRALYKFSQSGAAFALKNITDDMFF